MLKFNVMFKFNGFLIGLVLVLSSIGNFLHLPEHVTFSIVMGCGAIVTLIFICMLFKRYGNSD
ncbi:hypothetical protein JV33_21490 [Pectobacterium carotovorum subsp. carotovorum]|nr:hypothetical protein JV33_21490 [Pectobacterium carotovorum subsp. carotovorum]KML64951.1 hypothetical protein G032_21030 [Pectobacterium carotovorum subsp. carotovorum ICMP 5702]SHH68420.1 hypothetical protein SAMN05444147_11620 [Pectobacterium carotovorum]